MFPCNAILQNFPFFTLFRPFKCFFTLLLTFLCSFVNKPLSRVGFVANKFLSEPTQHFYENLENKLLCILTSFRVLRTPESWSNYFFQPFVPFFVHFKPFSVIYPSPWIPFIFCLLLFWYCTNISFDLRSFLKMNKKVENGFKK